jgi:hypothetical protein
MVPGAKLVGKFRLYANVEVGAALAAETIACRGKTGAINDDNRRLTGYK